MKCRFGRSVLVALLLALGSRAPAQGQVLLGILFGDKIATERFRIGLNIGLNISGLSGHEDTSTKLGFLLGLTAEWKIANHIYLQPELLPFYRAGAAHLPPGTSGLPPLLPDSLRDSQRKLSYFAIPVLAKYAFAGNRVHLGVGPQIGFLTSASDRFEGRTEGRRTNTEVDIKDQLNSFDAGVSFQLELKIGPSPFSPSLSARYYLGLTDTIKDNPSEDSVRNGIFSIFGSVPIGGKDALEDQEGAEG